MPESRFAEVGEVLTGNDMVEKDWRGLGVSAVLAVGAPARHGGLGTSTELAVRFMNWAPCLILAPHVQVSQLPQVMTQSGDERGVLPSGPVAGAAETIDAAVWPPLHNNVE